VSFFVSSWAGSRDSPLRKLASLARATPTAAAAQAVLGPPATAAMAAITTPGPATTRMVMIGEGVD
jgi:hypothetical protein